MDVGIPIEFLDFAGEESAYTECARLGCKKEVKRGDKCSCGMQN